MEIMKKLISMVYFVTEQSEIKKERIKKAESDNDYSLVVDADSDYIERTENYANFLNQPLTIGMFVPCDEKGKVLQEPQSIKNTFNVASGSGGFFDSKSFVSYIVKYEKAKESVLFEGFEIYNYSGSSKSVGINGIVHPMWYHEPKGWFIANGVFNIEDLVKYNLELTESGAREAGLI